MPHAPERSRTRGDDALRRRRAAFAARRLDGVRRIAVVRANGIGDFVFAVPALEALAAAYPDARITLIGAPWHAALLAGRPGPVHDVVVPPPTPGVWSGEGAPAGDDERDAFFARMRAERFDLALQMHGGGRYSNPFTLALGARHTAGLRTPDAAPLDRWVRYVAFQPEYLRYLEVVALVGAEPVTVAPVLDATPSDTAEAARALDGLDPPYAVLNPGATDPRRRWPPERFATVGDALAGAGASVVVSGSADDRALARAVGDAMAQPVRSVAGCLGLGGLLGLVAAADVVVSNDTGPLHLAVATGTPTVGVFWCGNLVSCGPPEVDRHRSATSWRLTCPECGTPCLDAGCEHLVSFVADVPVDEVLQPALELLEAGR